jgi:hypothetical protein
MGVTIGTYRGLREIRHSGSTAGYRAYLSVFPERRAAIAVLCNTGNAGAQAATYAVADRVLASMLSPVGEPRRPTPISESDLDALAGLYRNTRTGVATRVIRQGSDLRIEGGPPLLADGARLLRTPGQRWEFGPSGSVTVTDGFGRVDTLVRAAPWTPTAAELAAYEGQYTSTEAESTFTAVVSAGVLLLRQRPDRVAYLTPLYQGAFRSWLGTIVFRRDASGRVDGFSVSQDRVWDMRFTRVSAR